MKKLILLLLILPMAARASGEENEFRSLEVSSGVKSVIAALLMPYGNMEDFVISNESEYLKRCVDKTVIRAKTSCRRFETVWEPLYFAEGKGLFCKISDKLKSIKCLPKQVTVK